MTQEKQLANSSEGQLADLRKSAHELSKCDALIPNGVVESLIGMPGGLLGRSSNIGSEDMAQFIIPPAVQAEGRLINIKATNGIEMRQRGRYVLRIFPHILYIFCNF